MTDLEYVKAATGEADEALLNMLLEKAEGFILSYTGRTNMIQPLEYAKKELAVIYYNRMGTEGEKGRSEAGESRTFEEAPKSIYDILNRYRLAAVGGRTHEAPKKQS